MKTENLISLIKNGNRTSCMYHFTDTRNIPSIAENGILSRAETCRREMTGIYHGGNDWSFEQDDRQGVSDYVHLCFFSDHPMEFIAKREERIQESFFIKVLPEVLDREGIKFCAGVSNAANRQLLDICEIDENFDLEVLFRRTEWRNPDVQARLRVAKKYEILIPKWVPKTYLRK